MTRLRVVFLQHPRERRRAIGTARLTHLALPNSELYVGTSFETHARVQTLAADRSGRTALLFPGPAGLPGAPLANVETVIVPDGTWSEARKLLRHTPSLSSLPRVALAPAAPSRYRVRRAPAPHCLSTLEAVGALLARADDTDVTPLLDAFERLVAIQLAGAARHAAPYRHTRARIRSRAAVPQWAARRADLVLVHGEANAHPRRTGITTPAELLHLVALRPHSGERFVATIAPRRPLAPSAPGHLELPAERLRAGESIAAALAGWRAFLRPDDLLCTWGGYTLELLRAEGEPDRGHLDLRAAANGWLRRRAGSVEAAATLLAPVTITPAWTDGRAGRRLAALAAVLAALLGDGSSPATERVA